MFVSKLVSRLFSVLDRLIGGIYIETSDPWVYSLPPTLHPALISVPAPLEVLNDIRLSPSDQILVLNKKISFRRRNYLSQLRAKNTFPFCCLLLLLLWVRDLFLLGVNRLIYRRYFHSDLSVRDQLTT